MQPCNASGPSKGLMLLRIHPKSVSFALRFYRMGQTGEMSRSALPADTCLGSHTNHLIIRTQNGQISWSLVLSPRLKGHADVALRVDMQVGFVCKCCDRCWILMDPKQATPSIWEEIIGIYLPGSLRSHCIPTIFLGFPVVESPFYDYYIITA